MTVVRDPEVARSVDATIRRLRGYITAGTWADGRALTADELRLCRWQLKLVYREREELRRRARA